jgi:WD40 repeat protein
MKSAFLLLCFLALPAHASRILTVSRTGNAALVFVDQGANQPNRPEIWSLSPWKRRCVLRGNRRNWNDLASPAFTRNGRWIAFGCEDSTIEIYDARRGRLWARLGRPQQRKERYSTSTDEYEITSLSFSPGGKTLVASNKKGVFFWSMRRKKLLFSRPIFDHVEINGKFREIEVPAYPGKVLFSPDGKTIAIAGRSQMPVFLFDVARKRVRSILRLHAADGNARALAFSPGGNRLLVVGYWNISGGSHDQIQMFDTRNGRALWRWNNRSKNPNEYDTSNFYTRAAFSSDGRRFAVANDNFLSMRNARTARELLRRKPKINGAFSLQTQKTLLPELVMR